VKNCSNYIKIYNRYVLYKRLSSKKSHKPWYQTVNSWGCWLSKPNKVHMYNHLHNIHYTWGPWKQYFNCHREASIRGTHCTTTQVSHINWYIAGTKPRPCRLRGIPTKHLLPPRNHASTHSCWTSILSTSNQRAVVLRLSWIGGQTAVITLWRVIPTWHRGGHDRGYIPLILVTLT
jgi:hypothetical protein